MESLGELGRLSKLLKHLPKELWHLATRFSFLPLLYFLFPSVGFVERSQCGLTFGS